MRGTLGKAEEMEGTSTAGVAADEKRAQSLQALPLFSEEMTETHKHR